MDISIFFVEVFRDIHDKPRVQGLFLYAFCTFSQNLGPYGALGHPRGPSQGKDGAKFLYFRPPFSSFRRLILELQSVENTNFRVPICGHMAYFGGLYVMGGFYYAFKWFI